MNDKPVDNQYYQNLLNRPFYDGSPQMDEALLATLQSHKDELEAEGISTDDFERHTITRRLEHAIKEQGITKTELAGKLGINRSTLIDWIKNPWKLNQEKATALCSAIGVTVEYIESGRASSLDTLLPLDITSALANDTDELLTPHTMAALYSDLPLEDRMLLTSMVLKLYRVMQSDKALEELYERVDAESDEDYSNNQSYEKELSALHFAGLSTNYVNIV